VPVIMASMRVRFLGRFRLRIIFESVGRTQSFCLPGASDAKLAATAG
jgi:hypothetical protein